MTSVVFSTPGLIPIEAFTVFGMNAKPNSTNPFGFFGTGLKIAIAVCMRFNQEVVIHRGEETYTFFTKDTEFRGSSFRKIRMKREWKNLDKVFKKPFQRTYHDLPFTTELGKHWELWQAFREFQTNTMDENGETAVWNENPGYLLKEQLTENFSARGDDPANMSHIAVSGRQFIDEYHDRHRNFLPDGLSEREGSDRIQVLDRPSKHVYYRGVRVWDLKEESQFTYNFVASIELTEDRTAKYPFLLEAYICEYIMESTDEAFLQKTVVAPPSQSFERTIGFRHVNVMPSGAFLAAAEHSPNIAAKEIVKVRESVASSVRITIVVPKSEVTADELQSLQDICNYLWGDDVTCSENT